MAGWARLISIGAKALKRAEILDHMGSTELAANLFRAPQAERYAAPGENMRGKDKANQAHFEVGKKSSSNN